MYKPGTLVTLKDRNVYRTSKKQICVCENCRIFYFRYCKFPPCSGLNVLPNAFGFNSNRINRTECARLYGQHQFPKLLLLCGKKETS